STSLALVPVRRHTPAVSTLFSFTAPATPEIYTLSLHDALPILVLRQLQLVVAAVGQVGQEAGGELGDFGAHARVQLAPQVGERRSEEHTSELQSRFDLVCRLLLEKKKEYT